MTPRLKIISGGQTGVDQIALVTAEAFGLPTGGWCPAGCKTDTGPYPELITRFGLVEHSSASYAPRTILNVRSSDVTLWFGRTSPGYWCTKRATDKFARPFWENKTGEELAELITALVLLTTARGGQIVLNVAGNRWRMNPEASEHAACALTKAFELMGFTREVDGGSDGGNL